jgi:hypothetical protein
MRNAKEWLDSSTICSKDFEQYYYNECGVQGQLHISQLLQGEICLRKTSCDMMSLPTSNSILHQMLKILAE